MSKVTGSITLALLNIGSEDLKDLILVCAEN